MHCVKKIKITAGKILYGTIDQQINSKDKVIYGIAGLTVSMLVQILLASWLIPNRVMLNILATPFQLLGILSLMYIIQGSTKYPYKENSIWDIEDKQCIPFFIRSRSFKYKSYFILAIISNYISIYMDLTTNFIHFNFWFCVNNMIICLIVVVSYFIGKFIENLENIIKMMSQLIKEDSDAKDYINRSKGEIFNKTDGLLNGLLSCQSSKNERFGINVIGLIRHFIIDATLLTDGRLILLIFIAYRILFIYFSNSSWKGGAEYTFPLTVLWGGFTLYIVFPYLYLGYFSIMCTSFKISLIMKNINTYKLYPLLLHPDGHAGMKEILNFIYSNITKVLFLIFIFSSVFSLAFYYPMNTDPMDSSKQVMGIIIFFVDTFSLICFLMPLIQIRNIIRTHKHKQKEIFFERIKEYENKCRNDDLQEINYIFHVIENINKVPEWGFDTKKWIYIMGQILLTFAPLFHEILI